MKHLSLETNREHLFTLNDIRELRAARDRIQEKLLGHPLLSDPEQWNSSLNDMHDAFIERAVGLAEESMQTDPEWGPAPVPFAFVMFGSGGRREQTLWSDQDNGLIYADPGANTAEHAAIYMKELSERIVSNLEMLGYPPCDGNVLCSAPMWRKAVAEWQTMLNGWMDEPAWENVRYLLIVSDMRVVHGNPGLVGQVMRTIAGRVEAERGLLIHMLHNTLHRKISLGVFGQLITERFGEDAGGVDIKYGAYIPIVNGLRLLAIQAGIRESSTLSRLDGLHGMPWMSEEMLEDWKEAFLIALQLRSMTPFQLEGGTYSTRGKLPAHDLTKERKKQLKQCLRIGQELQRFVRKRIEDDSEKADRHEI